MTLSFCTGTIKKRQVKTDWLRIPLTNIAIGRKTVTRLALAFDDANIKPMLFSRRDAKALGLRMTPEKFEALVQDVQKNGQLAHVRVGLAKPYVYKDSNCYLMCNGIFFYNG